MGDSVDEPEFRSLRLPTEAGGWQDYLVVKQKIGKGAFCKVHAADVPVYRPGPTEGERIKGIQHMALKVFNKAVLRRSARTDVDPVTGLGNLSNQLKTVINKIKV